MHKKNVCIIASVMLGVATSVSAGVVDIVEYSSFMRAAEFGPTSIQHTEIGYNYDDYTSAGLGVVFTNSLNADNYGYVSWEVSNFTGSALNNVWFYGFLDAQIDEVTTSFFNETGDTSSLVLGVGDGDMLADTWEIDEPGYLFGDVFTNLLNGGLDNSNGLLGREDDVSLALGFNVGTLLPSESISAGFNISKTDNGGLYQYDPASDFGFYFSGSVQVIPVVTKVPEPSTIFLLAMGALLLGRKRRPFP